MIVLDASVMIALLDAQDAHHHRAAEFFRATAVDQFRAHRLTVAETLVNAVRHDRGPELEVALASLGIAYLDDLDDPLTLAEIRVRTGLRMPDACVLHAAIHTRARLATFDAALHAAARGVGVITVG